MTERASLYKWLQIEEIKENLFSAVEESRHDDFLTHLYRYLSTAEDVERDWSEFPWLRIRDIFLEIEETNAPTKPFPILRSAKESESTWGYEGRTWYFWLNLFSYNYGWSIDYIKRLDIDDAIGLLQEILLGEQGDRDFIWSTTEVAYEYNKSTKKSTLKLLDRPEWMRNSFSSTVKEPKKKKTRIRRDFLPVGRIVSWDKKND